MKAMSQEKMKTTAPAVLTVRLCDLLVYSLHETQTSTQHFSQTKNPDV